MNKHRLSLVVFVLFCFIGSTSAQTQQPLQADALENVAAFVRLTGYVRYFYPGDEATETLWDTFIVQHIESVEDSANPGELAEKLNTLFKPYAPLVLVFPSNARPQLPPELAAPPAEATSITQWVHIPMRSGSNEREWQMWQGIRVRAEIGAETASVDTDMWWEDIIKNMTVEMNDPGQPYTIEIGAGVSAMIPLALYTDENGTLPHISPPPPPDDNLSTARAVYLAAVGKAWAIFQHFFSYWQEVDIDWDAALLNGLAEAAIAKDDDAALFALQHMTDLLHDGHLYITQETAPASSRLYTLPFKWDIVQDQLMVTVLITDESALQLGDVITEINGQSTMEVINQQLETISVAGGYGVYLALQQLLYRPQGEIIDLTVEPSSGDAPYTLTLSYDVPMREDSLLYIRENRPPVIAELAPGIFYVDLTRISENSFDEWIPELSAAKGLVFDMRGYPVNTIGYRLFPHVSADPLYISQYLMPVVTLPDQSADFIPVTIPWATPTAPFFTNNIAWITNANNTVSQAESIMGTVEGFHLGEIVGAPTAGTNGDIVTIRLPGGYHMRWTGGRVTKRDGSSLYGVGVLPTIPLERTREGVTAGRDELLERAFEVTSGQPASAMHITEIEQP